MSSKRNRFPGVAACESVDELLSWAFQALEDGLAGDMLVKFSANSMTADDIEKEVQSSVTTILQEAERLAGLRSAIESGGNK